MDYHAYHLTNARSFAQEYALLQSGAEEFTKRGLTSTASLWNKLAELAYKRATRELLFADETKQNPINIERAGIAGITNKVW